MKRLFYCIGCALILMSCDPKNNYSEEIIGKWICTEVKQGDSGNILMIPTNDAFVMEFKSDKTLSFGQGYTLLNDEGSEWIESSFSYKVDDEQFNLTGETPLGETFDISATITQLSSVYLNFTENITADSSGRSFYLYKATNQYDAILTGNWEGLLIDRNATPDTVDVKYQFYDNSTFTISSKISGEWVVSELIGTYHIHGELLALNLAYPSGGIHSKRYECWLIRSYNEGKLILDHWEQASSSLNLNGKKLELFKK